jgi:diguanylate cyclase (GGDEF)-like protein
METISQGSGAENENDEIMEIINRYQEPEIYRELLFCLTNHHFELDSAQELWQTIVHHKEDLTKILGRDPGLKVAALDLLENVKGRLKNLKLIESKKIQFIAKTSLKDQLTSLYNRKTFENRLESEVKRARRYRRNLSLLLIDIDHFKNINDTRGHQAGDVVLMGIGRIILENLRESDSAYRYGGEEFAIVLVESNKKNAAKYAERLRSLIQRTAFEEISVTISVGCSQLKNRKDTPQSFVKRVDDALYKAKQTGRNRVCKS